MKVLLVNGSPNAQGCTFTALNEVAETLNKEGMQIMRNLSRNMAWSLRCKEAGIAAGVPFPEKEEQILTNFHGIRHPGS